MTVRRRGRAARWLGVALIAAAPLGAQQAPDSSGLRLGMLLQVVGDFQGEGRTRGQNGFTIPNARLRLTGELGGGFGVLLQANFTNTLSILDAAVRYRLGARATLQAGAFKAPFSREALTAAGDIDFVNRSQVVTALAPARQIGGQVAGRFSDHWDYGLGVFNGNGIRPVGNDNGSMLVAGRLGARPADRVDIAVSVAYSRDDDAPLGGGFLASFRGERTLVGADARLERGRWLLSAELIAARLDFLPGPAATPTGWHLTAGYGVGARGRLLVRWDAFRADGVQPNRDLLVLGYLVRTTTHTTFRINDVIPLAGGGLRRQQLLVGWQVAY